MINKIKSVDWIYSVLIILGIRSLVEASIPQALVVICFAALKAYNDYLNTKKIKDLDQETKKQLEEMKATVAGLAMNKAIKPQQMEQQIRRFF